MYPVRSKKIWDNYVAPLQQRGDRFFDFVSHAGYYVPLNQLPFKRRQNLFNVFRRPSPFVKGLDRPIRNQVARMEVQKAFHSCSLCKLDEKLSCELIFAAN